MRFLDGDVGRRVEKKGGGGRIDEKSLHVCCLDRDVTRGVRG